MLDTSRPVGTLLREWRRRRRLSQLDLSLDADISTRHLSFLETGRSAPSRGMLLRLAEQLDIPLRERNALPMSAGFAPVFPERPLDDPALGAARLAMQTVLTGHEPYPAVAVDRHWTMVAANAAVAPLLSGVSPALLQPPVNVMRVGLHPEGLAPRTVNLTEWRAHLLARLRRQVELSADAVLADLLRELSEYPVPGVRRPVRLAEDPGIVMPLHLQTEWGLLSLISTTTVFGTPVDLTVAELALETFFPANAATGEILRKLAVQPTTDARMRSAAQAAP